MDDVKRYHEYLREQKQKGQARECLRFVAALAAVALVAWLLTPLVV